MKATSNIRHRQKPAVSYQHLYTKFSVRYRLFGTEAFAEITKIFYSGTITYKCTFLSGKEMEIKKTKGQWIDLATGKGTYLVSALGREIDAIYNR